MTIDSTDYRRVFVDYEKAERRHNALEVATQSPWSIYQYGRYFILIPDSPPLSQQIKLVKGRRALTLTDHRRETPEILEY